MIVGERAIDEGDLSRVNRDRTAIRSRRVVIEGAADQVQPGLVYLRLHHDSAAGRTEATFDLQVLEDHLQGGGALGSAIVNGEDAAMLGSAQGHASRGPVDLEMGIDVDRSHVEIHDAGLMGGENLRIESDQRHPVHRRKTDRLAQAGQAAR